MQADAQNSLGGVVNGFELNRQYYDTYNRVLQSDDLLSDLIYFGLNSWQDGYRWMHPRYGIEEWSQSMFNAVDRLIGPPFRLKREQIEESIEIIQDHGTALQSVDAVLMLREYADKWLIEFDLQNPLWMEDGISNRLSSELAQFHAFASGITCRLPVPPGDWLTPQVPSDSGRQQIIALHQLYREIQTKGQIAPDLLVAKDQNGILQLRVLERLGLYHGYSRKPNPQMMQRVDSTIATLKLTPDMIRDYVL